ncbi:MAG: glycine cleavage system protein H [Deltaproteobacteria bacterium]|nr:glycine cleavage system protein H [Deltaproteobacteria bacterium]MBW2066033.1 glycine cleavage system protein H [Deltaproteobacteria bacterium]
MEIQGYNMPEDLYYEEHHFWVKEEGDLLVMGLDDFGQKMAGEIVYVQLPPEGKNLKAGKSFAKMESGKWLGKIYAPVNGELVEINEELEIDPTLINEDCYGEGWMFKIRPDDKGELASLIRGAEAIEKWILADIEKYSKEAEK